jgi:hypothetical protein
MVTPSKTKRVGRRRVESAGDQRLQRAGGGDVGLDVDRPGPGCPPDLVPLGGGVIEFEELDAGAA